MPVGSHPSVSVAKATHNATHMGSVHPMAGTISRFIKAMISSCFISSSFSFGMC
jgi:hypothetical protein